MMFDDAMDPTDAGLLELTRCLDAYADLRLSPSASGMTRMRTRVMIAAHRRAALMAAEATPESVGATTRPSGAERVRARSPHRSRPAAAFMAASLALAILAGTAYGAKPGGPLYATRLWIEMANLPTGLVARARAESSRLDARIAEAQEATRGGDAPAAEAALAAYSVIIVEAAQGTAGDPTSSAVIEISVTRHVVVLTRLTETVPAHARGAVQLALESSSKAINQLEGADTGGNGGHPIGTETWGGAAPSDGTESARPSHADEPSPAAGGEVIGTPDDPTTSDTVRRARDQDALPKGQSRGGGPDNPGQTAHPGAPSNAPQGDTTGTAQPGEPSAP